MFDRHEQRTTELHQSNSDGGDNVGRDKIIHNHLYGSVDYQRLLDDIQDGEELLAGIAPDRIDLRLKQSGKLNDLKQRLEDLKAEVFRLHELFTRIPINTERLRRAKEHFDKGEFREADAVLKAEDIRRDVERLKKEKGAAADRLAAIDRDLGDRANEFLLKARLSLLDPLPEGGSRFKRTEQWFEQALTTARTAEILFGYALILQEHNAFSRSESLYQEALKQYRRLDEAEPKSFLPKVATTLNNLANLHSDTQAYDQALEEYEEALEIRHNLAKSNPKDFRPCVSETLNNLGNLHQAKGEYGIALEKYKAALKIKRKLAKSYPEAFLCDVAGILNNLAVLYYKKKEYGSALAEYEKALKIRRGFAVANPAALLPRVADTLNNLAILHQVTKAFGSALEKYEEALEIRRDLAEADPEAFLSDLAATLLNLSFFYVEAVPDKAKSIAFAEEARTILIPLCARVPHLQGELDRAEQVLQANAAKPDV